METAKNTLVNKIKADKEIIKKNATSKIEAIFDEKPIREFWKTQRELEKGIMEDEIAAAEVRLESENEI